MPSRLAPLWLSWGRCFSLQVRWRACPTPPRPRSPRQPPPPTPPTSPTPPSRSSRPLPMLLPQRRPPASRSRSSSPTTSSSPTASRASSATPGNSGLHRTPRAAATPACPWEAGASWSWSPAAPEPDGTLRKPVLRGLSVEEVSGQASAVSPGPCSLPPGALSTCCCPRCSKCPMLSSGGPSMATGRGQIWAQTVLFVICCHSGGKNG